MTKRNLALSFAVGLAGGMIPSYFSTQRAQAQSEPPAEIQAQSFTLVNREGVALGSFSFDAQGYPRIILRDPRGREVWSVVADNTWKHARMDPR